MKYKVGDKVRIKSLDWYNKNKDSNGDVVFSSKVPHFSWHENVRTVFTKDMVKFCGKVVTIEIVWTVNYSIVEGTDRDYFTDEMIEGLVEEETLIERVDDNGLPFNEWLSHKGAFYVPNGYEIKDENGNIINATKIVLEKKKKVYPKTYEECCKVLGVSEFEYNHTGTNMWYRHKLMAMIDNLMLCRDAYWKIAGEEMGLDGPWESNDGCDEYGLYDVFRHTIINPDQFSFPTEQMRDEFKENFCKEL